MDTTKELASLIQLLDDPDQEIFRHVEEKLLELGTVAVGPLEKAWEESFNPLQQERIEELVHKIQFNQIYRDLELWTLSGSFDLLQGLIIVHKYQYPDADEQKIINDIEAIKREIWLQMAYSMTPVEKVRLFNSVFYKELGFSGNTRNYNNPQNSFIGQVLETRKGNPILLGCIYSIVAQKLDMPIYGVNLPQHFILAYTSHENGPDEQEVLFYINAFNRGQIFGRHDVVSFLKQLKLPVYPAFFQPCNNLAIIGRVLRNLLDYYEKNKISQKAMEIEKLLSLINEHQYG